MNGQSTSQQAPAVAKRLRLLQVEMHHVDAASRIAMLREQLVAVMDGIPAARHQGFLHGLARQFPDLDKPPSIEPAADSPTPEDLFLAMDPGKQAEVVRALMDRGDIEVVGADPVPSHASMSIPPPDPQADIALVAFLRNVVPFFLRTAESLGLRTEGLVDSDVLDRLEKGIAGTDPEMGPAETNALLEGLALAVSSLISVIPHLGKYCTQGLAQQLAAARIEDLSHNEGKTVLERWDSVYWRKYKQMSEAFSDGTLEKDIDTKVASHVDKWLQRARQNLRRKG